MELDKFLKENLDKGYIRPSQSPMASPMFFIAKKDKKLWPCQDYRYLNQWMIKNAYPLPLINEILDKLKGAKYFTKFDVRWGYNNVRIKKGDQWKAAFSTNQGLFKPMVMFFGLCKSPATFQAMMHSIFKQDIQWIFTSAMWQHHHDFPHGWWSNSRARPCDVVTWLVGELVRYIRHRRAAQQLAHQPWFLRAQRWKIKKIIILCIVI